MFDELVVDRPFVVEDLMGIGRLVVQHEDAQVADIIVILEVDDQEVCRFRFITMGHELVELAGDLGRQIVESQGPVDEGLQFHLKGAGRIEDARLLGGIADDAVQPLADVFVDDIAAEIEVLLGYNADVGIEIKIWSTAVLIIIMGIHPLRLFS